jgi:nucleoside-diphosphate-sugar epimerase
MRIAVTGHRGYLGTVLVPHLLEAGHDVLGVDVGLFDACEPLRSLTEVEEFDLDVRQVRPTHLRGVEAVIHLAAVSNDPMGDLNPAATFAINHEATVSLARAAREAGVHRFLFSSSCSVYGAADTDTPVDETSPCNPVTAYAEAKLLAERDLDALADDGFSPVHLRNATAFGWSPRLRFDVVVNNLTALAFATAEVRLQSDGSPWRPLVHVADIAEAFSALLAAPREVVHAQAFNIGRDDQNHRIRAVAETVGEVVEGSVVTFADGASPDKRSYRVSFAKVARLVPGFRPSRTVRDGAIELVGQLRSLDLGIDELLSARFVRLRELRRHLDSGRIDDHLRWTATATGSTDRA